METLKRYLQENFEGVFVLMVLVVVSTIVWFVNAKLAFLNFFYLPVLLGAYYLGIRSGVLGAFFTFLVVAIFASIYPDTFMVPQTGFSLWTSIFTWAGFLILTAVVVGFTHRQVQEKMKEALRARVEASGNAELLEQTMNTIREFESDLDFKVQERTRVLEEKTRSIRAHKDRVEETLYSTMDPAVVKLMIENRVRTEHCRISVLFADLTEFTRYSQERSAETVIAELNKYLADMEAVLMKYQAHIDKYLGDEIMAEFGAPIRHERHSLLAVVCALKMMESMGKSKYPFRLRIGIATGVATTGIIGAKRQSFTAFGTTVDLAAWIQDRCEPGRITVDEATRRDCEAQLEFRPVSGLSTHNVLRNTGLVAQIDNLLKHIAEAPENVALRVQVGTLLSQAGDPQQAQLHLKRALEIDPGNTEVKLALAETLVGQDRGVQQSSQARGQSQQLYEIVGLKNPVDDWNGLPAALISSAVTRVQNLIPYPEDLILPVECLDGSIGFSKLVGITAYLIGDQLNLPDQTKHDILEAGYLAELGKTIVSEHILNRNGSLTGDDFTQIHMHPRESVRKLRTAGYENEPLLEIIECHHENFDGSGYPAGLQADEIPIGARVIAVAEGFVSLTTRRPYREPRNAAQALADINRQAREGKFDPTIVQILGNLVEGR